MKITLIQLLAVVLGSIPGTLSRYYITRWSLAKFGTRFPYATLGINLTGCLLMGFLSSLSQKIVGYPTEIDLLVRVGFLGSYTTFSTYAYDTFQLYTNEPQNSNLVWLYWLGSSFLGIVLIYCGVYLADFIFFSTRRI